MISCSEESLAGSKNKPKLEAISSFAKSWIQLHHSIMAMIPYLLSVVVLNGQKVRIETL